jgi:hypothetical protein
VQMGGSANLAAAVALYDRVIDIRRQRWERITSIDGRHAAQEGECVGADGWVGQPRRSGSTVRSRHQDLQAPHQQRWERITHRHGHTLDVKAYSLVQMGGSANLAAAVALYDRVMDIRTAALGADHLIDSQHAAREGDVRW